MMPPTTDPYAAFGGSTAPAAPAAPTGTGGDDPYAAFGGATASQEDVAPTNWQGLQRFGHFLATGERQPTGSDVLDAAQDFIKGTVASTAEVPALVLKHVAPTAEFTRFLQEQAATPRDTMALKLGGAFENIAEWMSGEKALRGLTASEKMVKLAPIVKMLEQNPKMVEAAASHPEIFRALPDAARQAILGTAQTAAHGGNLQQSLESGATAGSLGLLVPVIGDLAKESFIRSAEEVRPTVREIGTPGETPLASFTQTAAEFPGPSGEPSSTRVQELVKKGLPNRLLAERQTAFKDLQTNLAKRGIGTALQDANDAMASSSVAPEVKATSPGGDWRYIPPDGSGVLDADEAQAALKNLKERWLDTDLTPTREAQIRQAYDDLKNQLDRYGVYVSRNPWQAHNVEQAVNAVNDYGDAANRLRLATRQTMGLASSEGQAAYGDLLNQREQAQSALDSARRGYDIQGERAAEQNIADINSRLEAVFDNPQLTGQLTPEMAAQALKQTRLANAFQELQNTMDRHFTLRSQAAQAIDRPRLAKNLEGLSDSIESIRDRYGDVLKSAIGDQGLNHIIELGDIIKNQPKKAEDIGNLLSNMGVVFRRHLSGIRGVVGGGGAYLAYAAGHGLAGVGGALGVTAVEAAHRILFRKMATDPEFAARMIYAVRNNVLPRVAAPLLASMATMGERSAANRQAQEQQLANEEPQ